MSITEIKQYEFFQKYSDYISLLPETDKKILIYIEKDLTQKEIAKYIGITQGGVSSKILKIKKRLKFLEYLDKINWKNIDEDLEYIFNSFERELIKGMISTTCQTEVARKLNMLFNLQDNQKMNQVKVRHRFNLYIERLQKKSDLNFIEKKYLDLFKVIRETLYILHEVKHFRFDHDRGVLYDF